MSNSFDLDVDIEMTNRAKQAASRLRVCAKNLDIAVRKMRQSGNLSGFGHVQKILTDINGLNAIITREAMKAQATIEHFKKEMAAQTEVDIA